MPMPAAPAVFLKSFASGNQVFTALGLLTLAHGLGAVPKFYGVYRVCVIAEGGWAVDDEVPESLSNSISTQDDYGIASYTDATNIYVRMGLGRVGLNKTTGAAITLTATNWRVNVRAWG